MNQRTQQEIAAGTNPATKYRSAALTAALAALGQHAQAAVKINGDVKTNGPGSFSEVGWDPLETALRLATAIKYLFSTVASVT